MAWIELPSVSKTKTSRHRDVELDTMVVIVGWTYVVAIGGMWGPQRAYSRVAVHKCLCSVGASGVFSKSNGR